MNKITFKDSPYTAHTVGEMDKQEHLSASAKHAGALLKLAEAFDAAICRQLRQQAIDKDQCLEVSND